MRPFASDNRARSLHARLEAQVNPRFVDFNGRFVTTRHGKLELLLRHSRRSKLNTYRAKPNFAVGLRGDDFAPVDQGCSEFLHRDAAQFFASFLGVGCDDDLKCSWRRRRLTGPRVGFPRRPAGLLHALLEGAACGKINPISRVRFIWRSSSKMPAHRQRKILGRKFPQADFSFCRNVAACNPMSVSSPKHLPIGELLARIGRASQRSSVSNCGDRRVAATAAWLFGETSPRAKLVRS